MIDYNFVPETLEWCKKHYVPPVKEHITCKDFGNPDWMNGSCHWCLSMYPYQCQMCRDESWVRELMSPLSKFPKATREEAAEFIQKYKQNFYTVKED